jgi:hypothetical protein
VQFPFDIRAEAEVGRLQQFIFSCFPIQQVMSLITELLAGQHMIVTSVVTGRIGIGCLALLALLYPLEWSSVFIPLLPDSLIPSLGSPFPYVIGIPFDWLEDEKLEGMDPVILVNLDLGVVLVPPEEKVELENEFVILINKISMKLEDELKVYKNYGLFPAARIQELLWLLIGGILALTAGLSLTDPELTMNKVVQELNQLRQNQEIRLTKYRKLLMESHVVGQFLDNMIGKLPRLIQNKTFMESFAKMEDVMIMTKKVKK